MTAEHMGRRYWTRLHAELGSFLMQFAQLEGDLFLALMVHSGVSMTVAKCIFSGVRADAAMSMLRRLLEATNAEQRTLDELAYIQPQFTLINTLRNDLLHHPTYVEDAGPVVATEYSAHLEKRVRRTSISPDILGRVSQDMTKIGLHLRRVMHPHAILIGSSKRLLEPVLKRAWLYMPQTEQSKAKAPGSPKQSRPGSRSPRGSSQG